jgi:hypothetical protein
VDTLGGVVTEVESSRAVAAAPVWSPDGRYILFSSDRTGITNLYAHEIATASLRQVTNVLSGAFQPSISANGRWLAFALYTAQGYRLARIPFEPETWREPGPPRPETLGPPPSPARFSAAAGGEARPYSPFPAILPAAWFPTGDWGTALGMGAGLWLYGRDAVGRHSWSAGGLVHGEARRVSGDLAYRYAGIGNPVADVRARQQWSVYRAPRYGEDGELAEHAEFRRDREAAFLLGTSDRGVLRSAWVNSGVELVQTGFAREASELAPGRRPDTFPTVGGVLLQTAFSSTRSFPLGIGPQDGVVFQSSIRARRELRTPVDGGEALGYVRGTMGGRAYPSFPVFGFARHVLALRIDGGMETGALRPGFSAGGAAGASAPLTLLGSSPGVGVGFPVRGYPEGAQVGDRVFSASAEYRFPLALLDRGFARLPLFFDRLWGDLFVDAGSSWCAGACESRFPRSLREPHPLVSVGAELNLEIRTGYHVHLPFRFGVALPLRDPVEGLGRPPPSLHLRLGRSF